MERIQIEKKIRSEFSQWRRQPKPAKDWVFIWVLSGADISWDGSVSENDTRRRFEEGIRLARKIASLQ